VHTLANYDSTLIYSTTFILV